MGMPGYNNALNRRVFVELKKHVHLHERIIAIQERRLSPFAAFKLSEIVRWTLSEALRGRLGVVRPFLAAGKNGSEVAKELERWKALAREAADAASRAKQRLSETNVADRAA